MFKTIFKEGDRILIRRSEKAGDQAAAENAKSIAQDLRVKLSLSEQQAKLIEQALNNILFATNRSGLVAKVLMETLLKNFPVREVAESLRETFQRIAKERKGKNKNSF